MRADDLVVLPLPTCRTSALWQVPPYPRWKRALDIALGGVAGIAFLPVLLLGALAIKVTDRGPVLFWQRRVGQGGREFWFPKLRSMHVGAEHIHDALARHNDHGHGSVTFKMRADPRITAVGRVLRTLSVDELPQLWCVLRGDMSLVGPRPPLPTEVMRYSATQLRRLEVKPGITGLWQVRGRSTISFEGQLALDIEYIERQSLQADLQILFRTIPAVVSCKGAW